MNSCDDYQNKVVAVLDCESNENDEKLVFSHLAVCPECRAFHAETIRTRQLFSIAVATKPAVKIGRQFMQRVEVDAQQSQNRSGPTQIRGHKLFKASYRRLWMTGGLAAAILLFISWFAYYQMSREVTELRSQLQGAQQDLAVARAQGQADEKHDRDQKAITALYLRMVDLERRVEGRSLLRTGSLPGEQSGLPDGQGDL